MDETDDKYLLDAFRKEDTRHYAFNLLVSKYQKRVYWHIRRMVIDHDDTDDLTQEVFIKVWRHLEGFKEDSQLFTWLYRIATNECITFLNKKKKRFFLPLHDVEKELAEKIESGKNYSGNEIELKLQKAILQLPEKQRLVFNMKYYENVKYEEMSTILGTSVGALKASYHHAVKKIEQIIKSN